MKPTYKQLHDKAQALLDARQLTHEEFTALNAALRLSEIEGDEMCKLGHICQDKQMIELCEQLPTSETQL